MTAVVPTCPMCGGYMDPRIVHNPFSRTKRVRICPSCCKREAIADFFPEDGMPRHCYAERDGESVLLVRGMGGFLRLGAPLRGVPARVLNAEWGVPEETAERMILASMFEWLDRPSDLTLKDCRGLPVTGAREENAEEGSF